MARSLRFMLPAPPRPVAYTLLVGGEGSFTREAGPEAVAPWVTSCGEMRRALPAPPRPE